ncbi:MAG: hypothetical protein OXN89_06900 [Bryobacterales bacterium]|nr:hypothetical protein [Bryobacterales bacterium]
MSANDQRPHHRPTGARPLRGGWTDLQRQEGHSFLHWVDREQRLLKGFEALATALRETLVEEIQTPADARDVWEAAPAVLSRCNDPATYTMRRTEVAYAWLHLLDRYVRTWLALEHLLLGRLLPMGRYGVRVLDVGTGPGPSAFSTHDFYVAMEDYARTADAPRWRQSPDITCVEPVMNHIRHIVAERLAVKEAPRSVLCMTGGLHDFSTILPTQERRQFENSLRNEYEEYYNEERGEWDADPIYTREQANWEANTYRRYRLFTFSNFLTTLDTISSFQANIEDILSDARAGSVLLIIGAQGGSYPAIQKRMGRMADAGGFRRRNNAVKVAVAHAQLDQRLCDEIRWFYRYLKLLAGHLPANTPCATKLRKELEGDQPIKFALSAVHAFRKS